ncbi:MAG: hypothetical protein ACYDCL_00100 [Myxococcales bacterium]
MKLLQPKAAARLAKIGAVMALEVGVAPIMLAGALLTPAGPGAERLLLAQNRLRQRCLKWILAETVPAGRRPLEEAGGLGDAGRLPGREDR